MLLVLPLCVLEWNVIPQNGCWWLTVVERREENSGHSLLRFSFEASAALPEWI